MFPYRERQESQENAFLNARVMTGDTATETSRNSGHPGGKMIPNPPFKSGSNEEHPKEKINGGAKLLQKRPRRRP